jgi:hypothetical protein
MGVGRSGGDIGNDISSTAFFGEAKPQATLKSEIEGKQSREKITKRWKSRLSW